MFGKIAAFEFRYQLKNPVFWVVSIIFFLLTFGATASDNISIGGGGNLNINSPAAIITTSLILTIFFMFVTTAFVANVVIRDSESGFGPMVLSTRVKKFDYLIGRFTGAFTVAALAFLVVPFAIFLGSNMPWVDPETVGVNKLSYYAFAYFIMALPGIFLTSAIFFAVATMTRSMMYSYVAVVLFLVLYLTILASLNTQPDLQYLAAYIEPFGLGAVGSETQYWTVAERNSLLPPLEGTLLANRLIWLSVAILALILAYFKFSFAEKGVSARQLKKQANQADKLSRVEPETVNILPSANVKGAAFSQMTTQMALEMRQILRSPAFFVLMMIGLFNAGASLFFANEIYGTPARPLTFALVNNLIGSFTIIPIIIAIYYSGELVWRDRDRKMHEIIDATPLPNWAYMVPKSLGVGIVLLASLVISAIAAIIVQLFRGPYGIDIGQYVQFYIIPLSWNVILIAVLAVFVQALSPNKYIGWGIMILYVVATITLTAIGLEHPMYLYGSLGQNPQFSDINGDNLTSVSNWWLQFYWSAFALMMAVLAHLLWRRGTETSLKPRLRQLPTRLMSPAGAIFGVAALVAVGSGVHIFNNTNILNEYSTNDENEELLANYEKKYLQYEKLDRPTITDVKIKADLYPNEKRAVFNGEYTLINDNDAPLETLHVRFFDRNMKEAKATVPGATLEMADEDMGYYIYRFDTPLAVNETMKMSFQTIRHQQGFRANGNDSRLVKNGTFLNNGEFAPSIGMDRGGLLTDRATRRKYDLPAELRIAKLEDESSRRRNYVGGADWVNSDITITTVADQIAIAPGSKVSDEVANGRRTARFVSTNPILAFFSIQSADFAIKTKNSDGVDISVYYHSKHDYNVDRMIKATEASLNYYKKNFGPYQFDHARIIEFPGYASFAQAFAGTMPYSESIGFIADNGDEQSIDYVTYITAHEVAHQYWAHQIVGANQQGGTVLVETMAQYSALMVMKQLYGEDKIRRFLKFELDNYLRSRGAQAEEEQPLYRDEGAGYIHYRKGSMVMYLLQDRLGEDRMNAMLTELINKYRFKGAPYPQSLDLVNGLKSLARNEDELALISDLMEKITLYDLSASEAKTTKLDNGNFATNITIDASKYYADGEGNEEKTDLSDSIEIGAFTQRPDFGAFDSEDVISIKRYTITSGEQKIRIETKTKPTFVGIDPYNKYIDRNGDDNLIAVE